MADIEVGTLYEMNKQLVSKEEPLSQDEYMKKLKEMATQMAEDNTYYLLINNRDLHYYTLFNCIDSSIDSIILNTNEILNCLGQVIDIVPNMVNKDTQDGFEIWIKHIGFENPIAFYMLNWNEGVIECD